MKTSLLLKRLEQGWKKLPPALKSDRVEQWYSRVVKKSNGKALRAKKGIQPVAEVELVKLPGFEPFDLVGDNWLDTVQPKPIAILWGFNPWKRKFVASYLQEYRVAFARGNTAWAVQRGAMDALNNIQFYVWGMYDRSEVLEYARTRDIPIARVEDGFIRSAELGAAHSLPLSLAIDRRSIYFDANQESDLEHLLSNHDFAADKRLMQAATSLRTLFCDLNVSKYNLGSFRSPYSVLGLKLKERVLVIGQVEDDASIRHGLAKGWTSRRLIELARTENPQAEIIYKPHPEVAQGFRTNTSQLHELEGICRVLLDDLVLGELFQVVDRVYVITSLGGLEALFHGLPVTVVGAPFYAGWGLTDDRAPIARRQRRLSVDELFCGAYLLYPRYLPDLDDPVVGCLAAILRVTAQRHQRLMASADEPANGDRVEQLANSDYWPIAFRPANLATLKTKLGKKLLSGIPVARIMAASSGGHYQRAMAYFLVGQLRKTSAYAGLLAQLRTAIRPEYFAALLTDLWALAPSAALLEQWAAHNERIGDWDAARRALAHLSAASVELPQPDGSLPIPAAGMGNVLKLAQYELRRRDLEQATKLFSRLLLSGCVQGDVFAGLAEIARLKFDFEGASALMSVFNVIEPTWKQGRGYVLKAQSSALSGRPVDALESLMVACLMDPQYVESAGPIEEAFSRFVGDVPLVNALQAATEVSLEGSVIGHAKALVARERATDAEALLLSYSPSGLELVKYCLVLSLAYSFQGKLEEAKALINNVLRHNPSLLVYREGLRLAIVGNDYSWGRELLNRVDDAGLDIGDIYYRKILLGVGDIKGSYQSFRRMKATNTLRAYLDEKYVQTLDGKSADRALNILVVACFGPGDEIRFASVYPKIHALSGSEGSLEFTCDPRLFSILSRSYPALTFHPVARIRSLSFLSDFSAYRDLPGSDLHPFFDAHGWRIACNKDAVILATDVIGDVIHDSKSFDGRSYLRPDGCLIAKFRDYLRPYSGRLLVGINWRSSITTFTRNEHYVAIEELLPVFEIEGIQFVNLQYDECAAELEWVEARFPGKLLNIDGVDQYNDLESVAAIMSCLDLVIAPATNVIEFAGALGCKSYLLSNSSELHWRSIDSGRRDIWHASVSHVQGTVLGDKGSLVEELAERLRALVGTWGEELTATRKNFWSCAE